MIRPQTPRRGARRTLLTLARLAVEHERAVQLHVFGCTDDEPSYRAILDEANRLGTFDLVNHGVLDREGVAGVMRSADVFVDFSDYQAFGRTGLEAMACGCAVLNPVHGGAGEYSVDEHNCLLVDTSDSEACYRALERVATDEALRRRLARNGLLTAARYSPERAAASELVAVRSRRGARVGARDARAIDDFDELVNRQPPPRERGRGYSRRLMKLVRDPAGFLRDSRFAGLRTLGTFVSDSETGEAVRRKLRKLRRDPVGFVLDSSVVKRLRNRSLR